VLRAVIGFLLGDPRQRPMHRAPRTTRSRDTEARRRDLLEGGALDPERQRFLLVAKIAL
jgi:hypothetical protein